MKFLIGLAVIVLWLSFNSYIQAQEIGWEEDFTRGVVEEEWYDNNDDSSFGAVITDDGKTLAKVKEVGKGDWGKVAIIIPDLDLDKYHILEVKVKEVELDSGFKVGVASLDWSEYYDLVTGVNTKGGVYEADIKKKTPWKGKKDLCLVLIVEGDDKTVIFDDIKIRTKY